MLENVVKRSEFGYTSAIQKLSIIITIIILQVNYKLLFKTDWCC